MRRVLACQPCNCYLLPVNGFQHKPPLCKGRWHFRKKMTVGLLLTFPVFYLGSILQSLSLAFARQPSALVAIVDCSPLWLKICHRHIFLTRRALYTREPLTQKHFALVLLFASCSFICLLFIGRASFEPRDYPWFSFYKQSPECLILGACFIF